MVVVNGHDDPVLARRARIARLVELGNRVGYTTLLVAVVAFFVGVASGFTSAITAVVTVSMLATTLVLAPAIVFGYAVKAAEREDRERGR
jgi:ABC-type transport system involved in cytochrome bd biosynthesis fused ATPase/permease subunit